jgi:hypothetical protein
MSMMNGGLALKLDAQTAVGIVKEVAAAGFGAEWEARMLLKIDKGVVDSGVIEFYTMGDMSTEDYIRCR